MMKCPCTEISVVINNNNNNNNNVEVPQNRKMIVLLFVSRSVNFVNFFF